LQTIKINGDYKYPPFEFLNKDRVFEGFNIDILNNIANELGIKFNLVPTHWAKALENLKSGNCDAIQGMALTNNRSKNFIFSIKYLTFFHSLFVLKNNKHVKSLDNLSNSKIAIQRSDVSHDLFLKTTSNSKSFYIVLVDNHESMLSELFSGSVQAIIGNNLTIMYLANNMKKNHLLKTIGNPLKVTEYGIAMKKNRNDLQQLFNRGIIKIIQKGIYKKVYEKWFGQEIDPLYSQILESVKTGIVCIDKLGKITAINNSAYKIINIYKKNLLFHSFFNSPLTKIFDSTSALKTLNIGKSFSGEISYVDTNNEDKFLNLRISPLFNHQNYILGAILSFRDITNEKKLAHSIFIKNKMESVGNLILTIAHEIRNPLTSIKTFIDMIPTHLEDEGFRISLLNHVPKQIKTINDLLKNLLECSWPKKPIIKPQNAKELVKSITKLLKNNCKVKFTNNIPDDFEVMADKNNLRQILLNILLNSIEALAKTKDGTVLVEGKESVNSKIIIISDNGPGIDKRDFTRIYDPFFTTKDNGTGLGLYIVYQLVKENYGNITIDSSKNGTKVILTFKQKEILLANEKEDFNN